MPNCNEIIRIIGPLARSSQRVGQRSPGEPVSAPRRSTVRSVLHIQYCIECGTGQKIIILVMYLVWSTRRLYRVPVCMYCTYTSYCTQRSPVRPTATVEMERDPPRVVRQAPIRHFPPGSQKEAIFSCDSMAGSFFP